MKGDFKTKYKTLADILADEELTADEQLREQVKHHSMCLFALACDLAEQQEKYLKKAPREVELNNSIVELKRIIAKMQVAIHKRDAYISKLREQLAQGKTGCKTTQQPKLPKRIPLDQLTDEQKVAIQAEYYEKRIIALETQVKYWRKKAKGADNGK